MFEFIRDRGLSLALVILMMCAAALTQGSIAYTFAFGALHGPLGLNLARLTELGYFARWGLLAVMGVLWLLKKKRVLLGWRSSSMASRRWSCWSSHERAGRPVCADREADSPGCSPDGGVEHPAGDTLPLTRPAKMLMLLQAAISVITLTGIAGSAINILAGTAGS